MKAEVYGNSDGCSTHMQPLISVIVPIYKVENCLERCLDSLCEQSLSNIEIILIDDASPDRCGEICEQYTIKDKRFKVVHHAENQGLSAARNTGIRLATANYLMFVDSDDWVHEDFCKDAYECSVSKNADLVIFGYDRVGYSIISALTNYKHKTNIPSGYKSRMEALSLNAVSTVAWNKLYRKDLFRTVSYPEGYYYEDNGTTYKTIWQARKIYYLDKILYYHFYRKDSITSFKNEKAMHDWLAMTMQQYYDFSAWGFPVDKLERKLKNIALTYCIKKKPDKDNPDYAYFLNILRSEKTVIKDFSKERKVLFLLLKYYPSLFEFICTSLNK